MWYVYEIKRRERKSEILLRKEEGGGLGKDPFALLTIARRYYPVLLIPRHFPFRVSTVPLIFPS